MNLTIFKIERFHHLPNKAVSQDHRRIAVFVREIECQHGEIGHLLHRRRRQHDVAVVAMPAALDHGEIVALFRRDVTQSRPTAHYIHNHARQFRAGQIGHAFLHQAEAGAGGSTQDAHPSRRCSIHHVDGSDFALRLQKSSANLGEVERGILGDFAGWSDRIAVVGAASGEDRALHHRHVSFTKLPHGRLLVSPQTPYLWP